MTDSATAGISFEDLRRFVVHHWGFPTFRPLQEAAMRAVLDARDSLVVLPTGGGKSLCYQAPAACNESTTLVISPLISLMKDQVDSLRTIGIAADQLNSGMLDVERRACEERLKSGEVRLLYVSPERVLQPSFVRLLENCDVKTVAIDEAHCISHWGHDFRAEYRQLKRLREFFPAASIHGYTATATERVQADIVRELGLTNAEILIGNFDRPNLTYRVLPREGTLNQVVDVLARHQGEAGIIYCIRRRDVDQLCSSLRAKGHRAQPYHAGLSIEDRHQTQEAFEREQCDVVVATVAFGMGIDRSDVRFVIHTGMPKSIEHYQQETGRAGRDGLEAECVLLYSSADVVTWKRLLERSAAEAEPRDDVDENFLPVALSHVDDMNRFCHPVTCRHRSLVSYFDQQYESDSCGACDVCLDGLGTLEDSLTIAQKILSCVARVEQRFGAGHVTAVLRGGETEQIAKYDHHLLSTYGLLTEKSEREIRTWIDQLIAQDMLVRTIDQFPVLLLNECSWEVLRATKTPRLTKVRSGKKARRRAKNETKLWDNVDQPLFEQLRALRRELATERGVPPFVIFSDATLRGLAAARPSSPERLLEVHGIGEVKCQNFGPQLLELIDRESSERELSRDSF